MKEINEKSLQSFGIPPAVAKSMAHRVNQIIASRYPAQAWMKIAGEVLRPDQPFPLHEFLFQSVYADWGKQKGPPPAWVPEASQIWRSNIGRIMGALRIRDYRDFHSWSVKYREKFWDLMVQELGICFKKKYSEVLKSGGDPERPCWFPGAEMNIADSCFSAPENKTAVLCSGADGGIRKMTYAQLSELSRRVAGTLAGRGFKKGDAIACYMPMKPESVALYLGIIMAGCAVVSIAESFSVPEVEKRLRITGAGCLFTQDVISRDGRVLPLYEKAAATGVNSIVVLKSGVDAPVSLRKQDVFWDDWLIPDHRFTTVSCGPDDVSNVLFSSGTTGDPKAIPWTHVTPVKCAVDGFLHQDIRSCDVVAWPSSLGWMMGPWLVYAGLINRASIALFDGAPTGREFARFVQDAGVTILGVVPSLVKAWRTGGCIDGQDWSGIRLFSSTGECSNAEDMLYLMSRAGYKPVIEYCGGTEIGGGYITGTVVQPAAPAAFTTPALGIDFTLLDEEGRETNQGEVFLKPPSIGLSTRLLNADHHKVYYEGVPPAQGSCLLRRHGDELERMARGWFRAHGRADDTMNLGGIKVSSAEIERVLNQVPGVSETAAVSVADKGGGPRKLLIFAVTKEKGTLDKAELKKRMQEEIKNVLNPLFRIHDVRVLEALPRTASNKVMRRKLREGDEGQKQGGQDPIMEP